MIAPEASAAFVANMEDVLEVYQRPRDPKLIFDSAWTQVFDCACRGALRRGRGTTKQKTFVDQAAAI